MIEAVNEVKIQAVSFYNMSWHKFLQLSQKTADGCLSARRIVLFQFLRTLIHIFAQGWRESILLCRVNDSGRILDGVFPLLCLARVTPDTVGHGLPVGAEENRPLTQYTAKGIPPSQRSNLFSFHSTQHPRFHRALTRLGSVFLLKSYSAAYVRTQ